jgi:hypothetical protein
MKTVINTVAGILIVVGLMAVAGSAGDCDGKCMEAANTLGEMLMVAGVGITMLAVGALVLIRNGLEG